VNKLISVEPIIPFDITHSYQIKDRFIAQIEISNTDSIKLIAKTGFELCAIEKNSLNKIQYTYWRYPSPN
jgi:L-amino acid N-acyltransferase YncA